MTLQRQPSFFEPDVSYGLSYAADLISIVQERELLAEFTKMDFRPFQFQGWVGKRKVASFGWRYDYNEARFSIAAPIPEFLLSLRRHAARFAELQPEALEQALVTRYDRGAGVGWHRDRSVFETVVGVSLLAPCVLRFRQRKETGFERMSLLAEPRSAYKLSGQIRNQWVHGIAEMDKTRYSVTFRSLRRTPAADCARQNI